MKKILIPILIVVMVLGAIDYLSAARPISFLISDTIVGYIATLSSNAQDQIDAQMTSAEHTTKVGAAYDTEAELKALMSIPQAITDTAGSVTATQGYKHIDMALTGSADPKAIVLTETGVIANAILVITNVHTNTLTFADSAGVQELTGGAATLKQYESITFRYMTDRWVEIARSTNAMSFSTMQAGMKTIPTAGDISLTAAQMNSIVRITGAGDVTIPTGMCEAANVGQWLHVRQSGTFAASIDSANASDQFTLMNGTAIGANEELDLAGTASKSCTVTCVAANVWEVTGESGTCADGGAKD